MPWDVCVPNLAAIIKVLDSYISGICSQNLSEEVSKCNTVHVNVNVNIFWILNLLIQVNYTIN